MNEDRMQRARLSLEGLSIGDAFGQTFFRPIADLDTRVAARRVPPSPWKYTDDTEMAIAIVEVLQQDGSLNQDRLAAAFARRYERDPHRGYGAGAHETLERIGNGMPWREAAQRAFEGAGSLGNGGAMRVAPLGAWFADDPASVVREARASAEITHLHPEGQAGAIAVAVAAAWASHREAADVGAQLLEVALRSTPAGQTRDGIARAVHIPLSDAPRKAAAFLGNGKRVTAPDTVPFALWCAARHIDNYVEALWSAVSVGGDLDTNAAIVGGIVALSAPGTIPGEWVAAREALPGLTPL